MAKYWTGLFLILFLMSACMAQISQTARLEEFISEKGNFKVIFPAIPKEETKERGEGESKKLSFWFSVSKPQISFIVAYTDYPNASIVTQEQLNNNYDNLRDGTIKLTNTTLIDEREVWINNKLGREFVLIDSKKIVIKYRVYLIDKRFYQLITSFEPTVYEDEKFRSEADKFLDSFTILEK